MQINMEIHKTKTGLDTIKINEYFVHSKYDPIREAQQFVEQQYTPHHTFILFGYGCGYILEALIKRRAFNEKIIVIDPLFDNNQVVFNHEALNVHAFKSGVIHDLELYINKLAADSRVAYKVISTPNYDKVFPHLYKELLKKVREVQYKNRTNDYTLLRYSKAWQNNFIRNLLYFKKDYNIKELYKKYNCPVVIASGGPSLSKQISLLKSIRHSIILIAAGSTINSLLKYELEPDYIVTIDGGEPNHRHFSKLNLENAEIVYSMQNHYKVRNAFKKCGFLVGTQSFKSQYNYIRSLSVDLPILEAGGSAAHTAFNLAQYITTGPVALIGQDLAYTNNLTHDANNLGANTVDEKFKEKNEAFQVEGYYGELVWTNPPFYSMKLDFEALINLNKPDVLFFNCTEGGLDIKGYDKISFSDFISTYVEDSDVKKYVPQGIVLKENISTDLKQIAISLLEIKMVVKEGLLLIDKCRKQQEISYKASKRLSKIDKRIQELLNNIPMESLTSAISIDILQNYLPKENETDREIFERNIAQSTALYEKLLESIDYTKECVENTIESER